MDDLFDKINNDDTGAVGKLIRELFYLSKQAAQSGIEINELASVCTMGWQSDETPEMASMFEFLLNAEQKKHENR
jgi:hypothetical protein